MRLDIAGQTVAAQQHAADLAHDRFRRGIVNELDSALADRELSSTMATIDPLRAQLLATERSIAVLLGEEPDTLVAELSTRTHFPTPPVSIDKGMPGELLRRRPDVCNIDFMASVDQSYWVKRPAENPRPPARFVGKPLIFLYICSTCGKSSHTRKIDHG